MGRAFGQVAPSIIWGRAEIFKFFVVAASRSAATFAEFQSRAPLRGYGGTQMMICNCFAAACAGSDEAHHSGRVPARHRARRGQAPAPLALGQGLRAAGSRESARLELRSAGAGRPGRRMLTSHENFPEYSEFLITAQSQPRLSAKGRGVAAPVRGGSTRAPVASDRAGPGGAALTSELAAVAPRPGGQRSGTAPALGGEVVQADATGDCGRAAGVRRPSVPAAGERPASVPPGRSAEAASPPLPPQR